MFERFTDRARRVVVLAQEVSRELEHENINTGHLLLGMIKEKDGVAAQALSEFVTYEDVKSLLLSRVPGVGNPPVGHVPFQEAAKKALELSLREALQLGHNYIGTEHILLGIIRGDDELGANILKDLISNDGSLVRELGVVRQAVIRKLSGYAGTIPQPEPKLDIDPTPILRTYEVVVERSEQQVYRIEATEENVAVAAAIASAETNNYVQPVKRSGSAWNVTAVLHKD